MSEIGNMPGYRRQRILLLSGLAAFGLGSVEPVTSADLRGCVRPTSAIRRVSAFDGHDPRQTVAEYAASHDAGSALKASGAVGRLICKTREATANVTLRTNIITTVGHILCDSHSRPADCTFAYDFNGKSKTIKVADGVTKLNCARFAGADDWAVLTLQQPVVGPTPLGIDPNRIEAASTIDVVLIADHSIDYCERSADHRCLRNPRSGEFARPKYMEDCKVRYIGDTRDVPSQLVNDCASSFGASGAAVVDRNLRNPVLLGVQVTVPESKVERSAEERSSMPVIRPFSLPRRWYAIANPVEGAFAAAIRAAAETSVPAAR